MSDDEIFARKCLTHLGLSRRKKICVLVGKGPSAPAAEIYEHDNWCDSWAIGDAIKFLRNPAVMIFQEKRPPEHFVGNPICIAVDHGNRKTERLRRQFPRKMWRLASDVRSAKGPEFVVPFEVRQDLPFAVSSVAIWLLDMLKYEKVILVGFDGGYELADGIHTIPNDCGYDRKLNHLRNFARKIGLNVARYQDLKPMSLPLLNLGCGKKYWPGWFNLDKYAEKADLRVDIAEAEFPEGLFERIVCVHVIEHLAKDIGIQTIHRSAKWLARGGTLEIEAPDRDKCRKLLSRGDVEGAKGLYGGRDKSVWPEVLENWVASGCPAGVVESHSLYASPGDVHLCVWTGAEIAAEMTKAGLAAKIEKNPHWHGNRHYRDFRVVGTKK